jgi:hypothetical protein
VLALVRVINAVAVREGRLTLPEAKRRELAVKEAYGMREA